MMGIHFGGQWFYNRFGNDFGNIELDLTLDETHEWSAEATSNPVEEGAPVSDHVIEQSDKLKFTGFVSDAPLTIVSGSVEIENRTQPVFDLLRELIKARETVTVYTRYQVYTDMVITSISVPFTVGQGEAIQFGIDFIKIRKVATQIVEVPEGISRKKEKKTSAATGKKAEPQKDAGKVETDNLAKRYPPKAPVPQSAASNLKKGVIDALKG
jgi:hypothetical protein